MELGKFYSHLDLPFQETKQIFLKDIFSVLERKFDLKKNSKQVFIDLGSGNAQVIIYCAINHGIKSIGIEIDPILMKEAKRSIRLLRLGNDVDPRVLNKVVLISGDFFTHNLKKYDYIYIYSLPTMQKYLKHVFQTVHKGAIIISHMYPLKDFAQYLELKFKINHKEDNQEKSTFFYERI
jgi:SAM-dependent methyltransferase